MFVVGGGPAGLAAAIAACQKGLRVTVADGCAPPIDKSCGEGLMPESVAALREVGVVLPANQGVRLRGIGFLQDDLAVFGDFRGEQGIGIRRTALHELLIARAEEVGIRLLWKTPVVGLADGGVQLKDGFVAADWIIGADGSNSRMRRWSGLDKGSKENRRFATRRHLRVAPWSQYTEVYWGRGAQAYVTPVAKDEVCVVIVAERAEEAAFEKRIAEWPALCSRLRHAELVSRERGAVTVMQSFAFVTKRNVALVGDASGGVDAITGDGLRLAFGQALALADAASAGDLDKYEVAHKELKRLPKLTGKLLLSMGRHPRLRSCVMKRLSRDAKLFARLLELHSRHTDTSGLISASARLGWELLAA